MPSSKKQSSSSKKQSPSSKRQLPSSKKESPSSKKQSPSSKKQSTSSKKQSPSPSPELEGLPDKNAWPTTSAELVERLKITAHKRLRCDALTLKGKKCQHLVARAAANEISRRIEELVELGSLERAAPRLKELALLVLCGETHRVEELIRKKVKEWKEALHVDHVKVDEVTQKVAAGDRVGHQKQRARVKKSPSPAPIKLEPTESEWEAQFCYPLALKRSTINLRSGEVPRNYKNSTSALVDTPEPDIHAFEPLPRPRRAPSITSALEGELLDRPCRTNRHEVSEGYIYCYTFPEQGSCRVAVPKKGTQWLKIGYAKDVDKRLREWASKCGFTPELVFAIKTPHYIQVENLVHTTFTGVRRRETGCPGCGTWHKEWIETDIETARRVVETWTTWAWTRPYDAKGELTETQRRLCVPFARAMGKLGESFN